jgi:hypothetical protein
MLARQPATFLLSDSLRRRRHHIVRCTRAVDSESERRTNMFCRSECIPSSTRSSKTRQRADYFIRLFVVPAKAGTHNHRRLLFDEPLPHIADTFRITDDGRYGSRLRGDDGGERVGISRKFISIDSNSHAASFPRRRASWAFGSLPSTMRGDGAPKGAPWYQCRRLFSGSPENRGCGNAFRRSIAAISSSLGPDFRARATFFGRFAPPSPVHPGRLPRPSPVPSSH